MLGNRRTSERAPEARVVRNAGYAGDVRKMQGEEDVWRRRVGPYRIFYEVLSEEKLIHVYEVARRASITY